MVFRFPFWANKSNNSKVENAKFEIKHSVIIHEQWTVSANYSTMNSQVHSYHYWSHEFVTWEHLIGVNMSVNYEVIPCDTTGGMMLNAMNSSVATEERRSPLVIYFLTSLTSNFSDDVSSQENIITIYFLLQCFQWPAFKVDSWLLRSRAVENLQYGDKQVEDVEVQGNWSQNELVIGVPLDQLVGVIHKVHAENKSGEPSVDCLRHASQRKHHLHTKRMQNGY